MGNVTVTSNSATVTVAFPSIFYNNIRSPIVQINWGDSVANATVGGSSPIWTVNNVERDLPSGSYDIIVTLSDWCGYSESLNLSIVVSAPITTGLVSLTTNLEMIQSESSDIQSSESNKTSTIVIATAVTAFVVVVAISLMIFALFAKKLKAMKMSDVQLPEIDGLQQAITEFEDIQFGNVIGRGNFGIVYK